MTDREYNFDDLDGCDYSEAIDNIAWRDRMRREYEIEDYINHPYVWFE